MLKLSGRAKGIIYLVLSALLFSIMPVLIRLLGEGGIPPITQVFLRYIFAFISAFVYLFVFSKNRPKIVAKDLILFIIATVFGYALTNLFFTYGILYTQVSNALFLFYSYAIMTPVLGFFILKEKITGYNVVALFLGYIALFLLFTPNAVCTWKIGGLFALMAAFGQSIYVVIRKILKKYPANVMMFVNTLVAVIVLGLLSILLETYFYEPGNILTLSSNTYLVTILFGIDNFLAWLFMTRGFELFKATSGSLILLSELIFGIFFALIFFAEIPTITTLFGGFLIVISAVVVIQFNRCG